LEKAIERLEYFKNYIKKKNNNSILNDIIVLNLLKKTLDYMEREIAIFNCVNML